MTYTSPSIPCRTRFLLASLLALALCACQHLPTTPGGVLSSSHKSDGPRVSVSHRDASNAPRAATANAVTAVAADKQRDPAVARIAYQQPSATTSPVAQAVPQSPSPRYPVAHAHHVAPAGDRAQVAQVGHASAAGQRSRCSHCRGRVHLRGFCSTCNHGLPSLPDPNHFHSPWSEDEKPLRFQDEYICDGGDRDLKVMISGASRNLYGLDQEDTVGLHRKENGEVEVTPSTRVCIYAPRFAAVRKVTGLAQHDQSQIHGDRRLAFTLNQNSDAGVPSTVLTQTHTGSQIGAAAVHSAKAEQRFLIYGQVVALKQTQDKLLPFEDLAIVRFGTLLNSEKLRMAESMQHAASWSNDQPAAVLFNEQPAVEFAGEIPVQGTHEYQLPDRKSRLRVVKLANKDNASSGDEIEFTIRFDNVGDKELEKVTFVDNLTTRLEYVPESANSTIPAKLTTEVNEGETLMLKWELEKPLEVGKGGVIRFKCRVR